MRSSERGQTLIELIVVIIIVVIIIGALVFGIIASIRNASFAKDQAQATKYAQEGIERVRAGRDRGTKINNLPNVTDCPNIGSWDGSVGGAIWSCKIYNTCGNGGNCYFNLSSNDLNYITTASSVPSTAETIGQFQRVIILSDISSTYSVEKTVTVLVTWKDFSGSHESRLTTILRKI